jgi:hypothetical protein
MHLATPTVTNFGSRHEKMSLSCQKSPRSGWKLPLRKLSIMVPVVTAPDTEEAQESAVSSFPKCEEPNARRRARTAPSGKVCAHRSGQESNWSRLITTSCAHSSWSICLNSCTRECRAARAGRQGWNLAAGIIAAAILAAVGVIAVSWQLRAPRTGFCRTAADGAFEVEQSDP